MGAQPPQLPQRPELFRDPAKPLPRSSGLTANSKTPLQGRWLPTPVLLVLLPILVIGFFWSVVTHAVVFAVILALLAVLTVVRLALTNRARG